MAALKYLAVHRYTVMFVQCLFGNRVALNLGLGGMRDITSAIISHEQTQSNRVCSFQTLDAVFPKDLFSDYLFRLSYVTSLILCRGRACFNLCHLGPAIAVIKE